MAQAIIIDESTKKRINEIKSYAEAHPYSLEQMEEMDRNPHNIDDAEMRKFRTVVPFNLCVCYVIETQLVNKEPVVMRHMSVYMDGQHKLPNPFAVSMMMEEFGFKSELKDCHVFLADNDTIINVMERY